MIGLGAVWGGAFGPDLWGAGLLTAGFLLGYLSGALALGSNPLAWPLLLLAGMGGVSLTITAFPVETFPIVYRQALSILCALGIIAWARTRARLLGLAALFGLLGVGFAAVAVVAVNWNVRKSFFVPAAVYAALPTLTADTIHPNVMASLLVLLFPLPFAGLLWAFRQNVAWRWRALFAASCMAVGGVLVLTSSRGGYLAAFVGALVAAWLVGCRRLSLFAGVLGLVVIGALLWSGVLDRGPAEPAAVGAITDPGTLAFRVEVWRTALWIMADFAFTGVGMGAFNDVAPLLYPFYETQNPGAHNLYLQVGVSLGLPGLIAYLSVLMLTLGMGGALVRYVRRSPPDPLALGVVGALAGLIGMVVHGLVDNTVWASRVDVVPWLLIGWLTAAYCHRRQVLDWFASQGGAEAAQSLCDSSAKLCVTFD
jgi:putative inorganic carbon (HCO3(-)) transporter